MPTISIGRKNFEKILGRHVDDALLKDRISYLGTDLEKADDEEIIVEIFPNRPDMLSAYGLARALSTFMGFSKGLKKYDAVPSGKKVIVTKGVSRVRPYTACAIVRGLELDDDKIKEIIQIQEKLHVTYCRHRKKAAIGIYPLEKIKFPITYTAKGPKDIVFRPLGADMEMNASEILEKHPAGNEYGYLLEGMKVFPVFIDAGNSVLSMPPIINSEETGRVTTETKEVFIECSGFDLSVLEYLLNMLVTAFADMGGVVYSMEVEYENGGGDGADGSNPDGSAGTSIGKITTPDLTPSEMVLDAKFINGLLGTEMGEGEMVACLEKMGYGARRGHHSGKVSAAPSGKKSLQKTGAGQDTTILIPSYRADIMHMSDLAEDVAIAFGYGNFQEKKPQIATTASEDGFMKMRQKVASLLAGLGLQEVSTYNISNKALGCTMMACRMDMVELENSLTEDYQALRAWVIPSLMKVLAENKTQEFPQGIFDMGSVFKRSPDTETGILEHVRLAVLVSHAKADFSEVQGMFDYLMRMLGMEYESEEEDHPSFIPGRCARISVAGKKVAYLGEIHPSVLANFGIIMPVCGFEVNLSEIFGSLAGQ